MRDGEAFDRPFVSDHVDRAPVGEVGDGQLCEIGERHLVVERRREQLARLRDEFLVLGPLPLVLVEPGGPDRRRREVCEQRRGALLRFGERAWAPVVEGERSENLIPVVERERHHRMGSLVGMGLAVLRCEPVGGRDVLGDDRRVERHGGRVPANRRHRGVDVAVREPRMRADAPRLGRRVVLPQGVGVRRERAGGEVEHLRQHRVDVEGAEERRGRLEQQPQPLEILGELPLGFVQKFAFDVSRQENPPGLGEL